jgi:single-strand DNA-binding protein
MSTQQRSTHGSLADLARVLDGQTLRHLAACADALSRPLFIDPERAADELVAMTTVGHRPTLGWWRRHIRTTRKGGIMTTDTKVRTVIRSGNLTGDPELRYSAKGAAWVTSGLAVNRRVRNEAGEWKDAPTEYFDLVCFGDLAENVAGCLSKGDRVVVVGKVQDKHWTGRDGVERTGHKLVVDDMGASLRHAMVEVNRTTRRGPADLERILAAQTADELFGEVGA